MKKHLLIFFSLLLVPFAGCAADRTPRNAGSMPAGTLTGTVSTTDGKPLAGVVVSDGVKVVRTDRTGRYGLDSDKELGYVFISIPSGYMAAVDSCAGPRFFARTTQPAQRAERHDFALAPVDNTRHTIIAATDHHLADRASLDVAQFTACGGFLDDAKATAAAARSPVYSICMGDMSWDEYWHSKGFMLPQFRQLYRDAAFSCPVFHAMGNHDNDPYCTTDGEAARAFVREIGPTYYSFNLGKLHYVVLDNIFYINTGGRPGAIGKLDYEVRIDERQMEWLRADLATVEDRTAPLVVVMHAQLHWWQRKGDEISWRYAFTRDADRLVEALSGFDEVHLVTGHSHQNFRLVDGRIREHNIAATSGTWWWTGQIHDDYAINVCLDGSPGGYEVFEVDGCDIRWYYKGIGCDAGYQFRAYDMNEVLRNDRIRASGDFTAEGTARGMNDAYAENDILLNVWGWQPDWTIRVTENGRELEGVRVVGKDPLHKIAYTRKTVPFQTAYNPHMWRYRASGPATTLRIEVTDSFGCTSTETMARPKAFHTRMR